MPRNPHSFQFKQFTVQQDACGMKVCTDACLFGALVEAKENENWLDIGTGTGLLALQLAQRHPSILITALEIDRYAAAQATQNVAASPFSHQISVVNEAVQQHVGKYDGIIVNPPFYENSLHRPNQQANMAMHHNTLTFSDLAASVNRLLNPFGNLWVLLPPFEQGKLVQHLTTYGLVAQATWQVRHNAQKPVIRSVVQYGKQAVQSPQEQEINMYEVGNNQYSSEFMALLQPYYLNL